MNRFLACLLALALLLPIAGQAEKENQAQPLEAAELNAWNQGLLERAIRDGLSVEREENGGFVAHGRGYSIYPASEDLSQDTLLLGAVLDAESIEVDGLVGPRGLPVTLSAQEVLAAFANDNRKLQGDAQGAALYLRGELPGPVLTGVALRDGQRLMLVEYCVYTPDGEEVDRAGIQFTIEKGTVRAIRSFGGDRLSLAKAEEEIDRLIALQEETGYFAYDALQATPMQREDLVFAGIDFLDLSPKSAKEALGEPISTEKVPDSNGETLELMQWEALTLTFVYDQSGAFQKAIRAVIYGDLDGPRGLRPGVDLITALSRFENTAGDLNAPRVVLYGEADKQEGSWGLMLQEVPNTTLYYAVQTGDESILFSALFIDEKLMEMSLTRP